MSEKLKRRLEGITELLERLSKKSGEGIPIMVEGRNDIMALRNLGIRGEIIAAKNFGRSFLDVLREVKKRDMKEVILLMDFDRRGKELTKRLTQNLERTRTRPNKLFWRRLMKLVGGDLKDIEGLATYLATLEKKFAC